MARWNKLSKSVCDAIVQMLRDSNLTYAKIADMVGVSRTTVLRVGYTYLSFEERQMRKICNYRSSKMGCRNPSYGLCGEMSRKYKGIISDGKGYELVLRPEWFTGRKKSKHVFVHHVVACMHLGLTKIPEKYVVHHCDLNRANNDFSNLVLLPSCLHVQLHHYLSVIEGATTISKESTLKWAEAHGYRFEKSVYDIV